MLKLENEMLKIEVVERENMIKWFTGPVSDGGKHQN